MKIQNRDRLKAKLNALPDAVKAEIRKSLETSAGEIVDLAKRFAPVKTGALNASIGYIFGDYKPDNSNVRGVAAGGGSGSDLTATIYAGDAKAFYARFVEFGTSAHINQGEYKGSQNPGMRAEPFFYPAYRLGKKRAIGRLGRAYNTAARKVAGKS